MGRIETVQMPANLRSRSGYNYYYKRMISCPDYLASVGVFRVAGNALRELQRSFKLDLLRDRGDE